MTVHLAQLTDMHLYADATAIKREVCTRASFEAVVAAIRRDGPTLNAVLATGDIAEDESVGAYEGFRDALADAGAPVLCLPGNHDDPALMQTLLNDGTFRYLGAHRFGRWTVVLLDSRVAGRVGGALSNGQLDALDIVLRRHADRHALVCLHHPPVSMQSAWLDTIGLADADRLWSVLDRHEHVRGVLWGHAHQALDSRRGDVHLMCTPSTGRQFAPRLDDFDVDDRPPAWRHLALGDDGAIDTRVVWVPDAAQPVPAS